MSLILQQHSLGNFNIESNLYIEARGFYLI